MYRGFFGKLPARGDFVSAGLPRHFVTPWDRWICDVLPAALAAVGDGWIAAPVWQFTLAHDVCGIAPAGGLLFPSTDRVGRRFPLTFAWIDDGPSIIAAMDLGRSAIAEALPPDILTERLAAIERNGETPLAHAGSLWTHGTRSLKLPALPSAAQLAEMMTGLRP